VPAPAWASFTPPDTSTPGEQAGTVEYEGKTARYLIYVYDGTGNIPYGANGEPEMHVPL
jgi:hypothetical protein